MEGEQERFEGHGDSFRVPDGTCLALEVHRQRCCIEGRC